MFIRFSHSVLNFLLNRSLESVQAFFGIFEFFSIQFTHVIQLGLKFLPEHSQLVFKFGSEGFQGVIDSFCLSLGEISVCLDLPLNILELSFELLFGLDTFHEHDVVVTVHLDELIVHVFEWHILILLLLEAFHIFLNELLLDTWYSLVFTVKFPLRLFHLLIQL